MKKKYPLLLGAAIIAMVSTGALAETTSTMPVNFKFTNGDGTAAAGLATAQFTVNSAGNYSILWLFGNNPITLSAPYGQTQTLPSAPIELYSAQPISSTLPINLSVNFAGLNFPINAALAPNFSDSTWQLGDGKSTAYFGGDNQAVCYVNYTSGTPVKTNPTVNATCYSYNGINFSQEKVVYFENYTKNSVLPPTTITNFNATVAVNNKNVDAALLGSVDPLFSAHGINPNYLFLAGAPVPNKDAIVNVKFNLNFGEPVEKTIPVSVPIGIGSDGTIASFPTQTINPELPHNTNEVCTVSPCDNIGVCTQTIFVACNIKGAP